MTRRDDIQTIHEPFGDAFYYGPEKMGTRFSKDEEACKQSGFAESTFKTIMDRIERESAEVRRCPFVLLLSSYGCGKIFSFDGHLLALQYHLFLITRIPHAASR